MRDKIAKWAIANGSQPAVKSTKLMSPSFVDLSKSYKEEQIDDGNNLKSIPRKRRAGYNLLAEQVDIKVI